MSVCDEAGMPSDVPANQAERIPAGGSTGLGGRERTDLADPGFRRLYLACDEAFDWDPADPRLAELADAMVAWSAQHQPAPEQSPPDPAAGSSPAVTLMSAHIARSSPAWSRLSELSQEKLNTLAHSPEPSWLRRRLSVAIVGPVRRGDLASHSQKCPACLLPPVSRCESIH
jgi:hypothetical protein